MAWTTEDLILSSFLARAASTQETMSVPVGRRGKVVMFLWSDEPPVQRGDEPM